MNFSKDLFTTRVCYVVILSCILVVKCASTRVDY